MADKTKAEIAAEQINAQIADIKDMVNKSATAEALKAATDDLEAFKSETDLTGYETKMAGLEKDIKTLTDKVGKMSIGNVPGGHSLRETIKSVLETDDWVAHLEDRARGKSPKSTLKNIVWGAAGAFGTNDVVHNFMPFEIPQYPFEEPFDVRSIIPTGTCDSGSLDYPQEKAYTDGMGVKGEIVPSDVTELTFDMKVENAHRIPTFAQVSRRALRNTTWLSAYLTNRFMEKFIKTLNTQVLAGDGTGENLNGILTQASAFATGTGLQNTILKDESTLIDSILALQTQLYDTQNCKANAVFVSPITRFQLTTAKTTTRDYANSTVLAQNQETGIWKVGGMSIIETKDVPDGTALVGLILPTVLQVLFNGGIDMSTTESHASNFIASLVTFRFEADVLFPIYRPYAFLKGVLTAVQTDITAAA